MFKTLASNAFLALCCGALLVGGCGDDAKQKGVEDSEDPVTGDDAGVEPDAEAADAASEDEEKPDPIDQDDAGPSPSKPDAGSAGAGPNLNLPSDGNQLSICYGHEDCKADGLGCFGAFRRAPGFCSAQCDKDDDCAPLGGLATSCGPEGLCRVDCSGNEDEGDGACPANMVCRDFFDLSVVVGGKPSDPGLLKLWRCGYPVDAGGNHVERYQRCDLDHGDGDCKGDLMCHAPSSTLGRPANPGYCADGCQDASDCSVPGGTSALAVCADGACELDCAAAGSTCPGGMNCRQVGLSASQTYRCRFIAEQPADMMAP